MVDAGRENDEVVLGELDAHPVVILAAHIKVSLPVADVTNLLVLMQVLVEEGLDLFLVDGAHLLRRHKDFVAVLVTSLLCQLVDARNVGNVVVEHAELGQLVIRNGLARVVRQTLVALKDYNNVHGQLTNTYYFRRLRNRLRRSSTHREVIVKVRLHLGICLLVQVATTADDGPDSWGSFSLEGFVLPRHKWGYGVIKEPTNQPTFTHMSGSHYCGTLHASAKTAKNDLRIVRILLYAARSALFNR